MAARLVQEQRPQVVVMVPEVVPPGLHPVAGEWRDAREDDAGRVAGRVGIDDGERGVEREHRLTPPG